MPNFQANVKDLAGYKKTAPNTNKDKIQDVIDQYNEKKIRNFKTTLHAVMLLSSTNKHTIQSGRADKEYNKLVRAYKDIEPMTGRLERERQATQ